MILTAINTRDIDSDFFVNLPIRTYELHDLTADMGYLK
jgi:hypothetical protein